MQAANTGADVKYADAVAEVIRRCWSLGVFVQLSPKEVIDIGDGVPCSGYFDDEHELPVLAVATGKPEQEWLKVLLHEYGHASQWAEQAPCWIRSKKAANWIDWLEGKPVKGIAEAIEAAREVEADCERRTIRLIKELGLDIDIESYTRAANAYVHFYNLMATHRAWFAKGKAPYNVPEVLAAANPTMDKDFSKTPRQLLIELAKCLEPKNNNKKAKG